MKNSKGITLIALVITIIVLLILAAVSIAMLTGENGIIGKAKTASEEHTEKAALEKLKLKLTEYIIDQNDNINPVLKEYLEAIEGCSDVCEDKAEDNIGGYIVVIDGYEFRVSANGEVLESLGKATSPRIVITQNKQNVEISITERGENVTVLEILDSADQVIASATKEDMTKNEQSYVFNYAFSVDGTYVVRVKTQEGKEYPKEVIIDLTPPATPVITSNYGYPIITESGVIMDGTTKITYDTGENIENYYSLDGTNWKEYTGEFQYAQAGTIYAKSVKKSNGMESSSNKTISIPSGALGAAGYDGSDATYVAMNGSNLRGHYGIVKISPGMIGKKVRVLVDNDSGEGGSVYVHDSAGTQLAYYDKYRQKEYIITIPFDADYLRFYCGDRVYEVSPYSQ